MKLPTSKCFAAADRLGQHPVGHVADQHVLERQLALAGQPHRRRRDEDVLLLERAERLAEVASLRARRRRQRALPERAPHDGRLLHQPPLERLERVEPRRQQGLHGVGQLGRLVAPVLARSGAAISSANSGLPPARSATAGDDLEPGPPAAARATSSRRLLGRQRARGRSRSRRAARRPSSGGGRAARRAPGRRSCSGARTHCARCSIRSSIPSSAQWMSSNASTSGLRRRDRLDAARTRRENASRMRSGSSRLGHERSGGTSMPSSRPISAACGRGSVVLPRRRAAPPT